MSIVSIQRPSLLSVNRTGRWVARQREPLCVNFAVAIGEPTALKEMEGNSCYLAFYLMVSPSEFSPLMARRMANKLPLGKHR
jgi:hypothetical protein